MASRKTEKQRLEQQHVEAAQALADRRQKRFLLGALGLLLSIGLAAVVLAVLSGSDDSAVGAKETFAHVHGLGVNPADQALLIATHEGLFRSGAGDLESKLVGDTRQDVMGFGISGPNTFVGSGHPALGQNSPPNLGLIRSSDAGKSWNNVSLLGEADFHTLRAAGLKIYGLNGSTGELLVSDDSGANWEQRELPEGTVDFAIDPKRPDQAVAVTSDGSMRSDDAALSWVKAGDAPIGLIDWSDDGRLYIVDQDGAVSVSEDEGENWTATGKAGGTPAAISAAPDALYVALENNAIEQSTDDGATWSTRLQP